MNNIDTEQTHGFYTKDFMILKFKHMEIVMTLCACKDFQVVPTYSTMSIFDSIT